MDDRKEVLLDYIVSYSNQLLATDERQRGAVKKGKLPSTELDDERQAKLDRKLRELGDRWEHIHENGEHVMKNNLTSIHGHSASLESCLNELTGRESKPLNVDIGPPELPGTVVTGDEGAIWDPFTGSHALRETGFEAGPSNPSRGKVISEELGLIKRQTSSVDQVRLPFDAEASFPTSQGSRQNIETESSTKLRGSSGRVLEGKSLSKAKDFGRETEGLSATAILSRYTGRIFHVASKCTSWMTPKRCSSYEVGKGVSENIEDTASIPSLQASAIHPQNDQEDHIEDASMRQAIALERLFRQERLGLDIAERWMSDAEIVTFEDDDDKSQAMDLMLAMSLAEGSSQDYATFLRPQSEPQGLLQQGQTELPTKQSPTRANRQTAIEPNEVLSNSLQMATSDRELAMRLQAESSVVDHDRELAQRLHGELNAWKEQVLEDGHHTGIAGPSNWQQAGDNSEDYNTAAPPRFWDDHALALRLAKTINGSEDSTDPDINRTIYLSTRPPAPSQQSEYGDNAYARRLELKEQRRITRDKGWRLDAQRWQDMMVAQDMNALAEARRLQVLIEIEDRAAQERLLLELEDVLQKEQEGEMQERMAEIAHAETERIRQQNLNECVVCNDQFQKHQMLFLRCRHTYCRGCLLGKTTHISTISYTTAYTDLDRRWLSFSFQLETKEDLHVLQTHCAHRCPGTRAWTSLRPRVSDVGARTIIFEPFLLQFKGLCRLPTDK